MENGFVALVGAGPGGRGWLTLRGAELLDRAQTVVYDRLVSEEILQMIPSAAKRIDVGKQSGRHPVPQEQINEILLMEAQNGRLVVRLKGGDPYLFGRGGEELELLVLHGIPFEVVPGITSALAAPGAAGIPATHRDCCSSVHIITGHARAGGELSIDFEALARLGGTLVFLMGVAALPGLMDGLLAAGMSPDTPAAAVENGGRPQQRKILATVGTLTGCAQVEALASPAVLVVGEVCKLADRFDWFSRRTLFGRKFVICRPKGSPETLSARLRELGARVAILPCGEIRPIIPNLALDDALARLQTFSWLLFTSRNGVEAFWQTFTAHGLDARALAGAKLGALGAPTAGALLAHGLCADLVPAQYDGEHLGREVAAKMQLGETALLCDALHNSGGVERAFAQAAVKLERVPVYETILLPPLELPDVLNGRLDDTWEFLFTSASTVEGAVRALTGWNFTGVRALCIGGTTAAAAEKHGFVCRISKQATIDSMIETLTLE